MMQPVETLRHLVELESPTGDRERMAHIRAFLAAELAGLGGQVSAEGEHLVATFGGHHNGDVIVLAAHMDTVWPAGTLQRMPFRVEGDLAHGPGALDMKGGIVVLLEGLRRASPLADPVSVLVEELAKRARAVLVLEPPVRDGTITTSRSGLARYQLRIRGRAAHAGHQGGGVSAVVELAHQTLALSRLVDPERGVRVNVGQVAGGSGDNVVAAEAWARIDARAWTGPEQQQLEAAILGLHPVLEGIEMEVSGGVTRPPMNRSPESARLAERAVEIAASLGQPLAENASGGGSDGNFAAAIGAPVLDGLGPTGAGAHADDERVSLRSIDQRSELLAALIGGL
jgi:glutamate carboxypeptidase